MRRAKRRERLQMPGTVVVLLVAISAMAGCATTTGKKAEKPPVKNPVVEQKTAVARLSDGREGFVITESVPPDSALRSEFDRAVALMGEGAHEEAIEIFEDLIVALPDVSAPHIDVSLSYLETERPELAEEHLKAALNLVPGHPVASNVYGLLLRRAGRFEEARKIYEEATEKFPEYPLVRKNLGILCELYLADPACALEQYEVYSESNPEDEQVKLWMASLRLLSGD